MDISSGMEVENGPKTPVVIFLNISTAFIAEVYKENAIAFKIVHTHERNGTCNLDTMDDPDCVRFSHDALQSQGFKRDKCYQKNLFQ